MSKPSHVFVTAPEGRICPIAPADATAPGGVLLKVEPGKLYRLPLSSYVRRRIAAGDLLLRTPKGAEAAELAHAAAPEAQPTRPDGSLELETPAPPARDTAAASSSSSPAAASDNPSPAKEG